MSCAASPARPARWRRVAGRSRSYRQATQRVRAGHADPLHDPVRQQPLSGESATLFRESGDYDGRKDVATVKTDAAGAVAFTAPDAGRYVLLVRHRADPAATGPAMSHTGTVAFEAM